MKKFKDIIPKFVQILILGVLAIYYLVSKYPGRINLIYFLKSFLPVVLIFVAIMILLVSKKLFTSHVVTFLVGYFIVGRNALLEILSFDLKTMTFQDAIGFKTILYAIIFIYFILMIFSYLLSGSAKGSTDGGKLIVLTLSAFILFYFTNGYETASMMLLPTFISLIFGLPAASILLLLSSLVNIPLDFIILINQGVLLDQSIAYFLFFITGLVIIFLTIKKIAR